jgi:hypothetical protein
MKKKLLCLSLTFSLLLTIFVTPTFAADYIDGNDASPIPPRVENGVTLVPMRSTFEILGATVDYNSATKTITATKDSIKITLVLNSKNAYINGQKHILDVPAKTVKDYTLVPLRFVSEALQANVDYNSLTKYVTIVAKDGTTIIFDLTKSPSNYIGTWKLTKVSVYGLEFSPQILGISSTLYITDNDNATFTLDGSIAYCSWTLEDNVIKLKNKNNKGKLDLYIIGSTLLFSQDEGALHYTRQ